MSTSKLMNVAVTVESRSGQHAAWVTAACRSAISGRGPPVTMSPEETEQGMLHYAEEVVRLTDAFDDFNHPIDIDVHRVGGVPASGQVRRAHPRL